MASWFDNVINWGIPIGVILFLFSLFYVKFKSVFDALFSGARAFFGVVFGTAGNKSKQAVKDSYEVVYRYGSE